MQIREVAAATGLTAHTIRYYETIGVLPSVGRSEAGVREFTAEDVNRLRFVVMLKRTGLPLDDIITFLEDGCILERLERGDVPAGLFDKRTAILTRHKAALLEQRRELDELLAAVDEKLAFYERAALDFESTRSLTVIPKGGLQDVSSHCAAAAGAQGDGRVGAAGGVSPARGRGSDCGSLFGPEL